jgi:hypothetical protein
MRTKKKEFLLVSIEASDFWHVKFTGENFPNLTKFNSLLNLINNLDLINLNLTNLT